MKPGRARGLLQEACLWTYRLALLNLLWIGLSAAGLIIFGIFPATVAMFAVVRRWMTAAPGEEVTIVRTFWAVYRSELFQANCLGLGVVVLGGALYTDVNLSMRQTGPAAQVGLVLSLALSVLYGLMLLYLFPVYVHLQGRWHWHLRLAAVIGVAHPVRSAILVVGSVALYLGFAHLPALFVFFGGSLPCTFALWQTLQVLGARDVRRGLVPAQDAAEQDAAGRSENARSQAASRTCQHEGDAQ